MHVSLTRTSGGLAYLEDFREKRGRQMSALSSLDGADDDHVLEVLSDENRTARITCVT